MNLFYGSKNHLDLYLNEDCNLRCSHCFIGEKLETKNNIKWNDYINIITTAKKVEQQK